jgi:phosphate transport system permease protein
MTTGNDVLTGRPLDEAARHRSVLWRRGTDLLVKVLSVLAALIGLAGLTWILWTVVMRGAAALNWDFFVKKTMPVALFPGDDPGGMGNAIVGTLILSTLSAAMGVPIGVLAGVYLAEFGRHSRFADAIRFLCNVLMGVPSIIVGIFIWGLLVSPFSFFPVTLGFSAWAGAIALAIIMIPLIARTTEDMLNLVPNSLRESALAIGAPRWRITLGIIFKAARSGLLTAVLLGLARVSGETAPLLFTAFNSMHWYNGLGEPVANLTVTIYNRAMSPFPEWQQMAWGASLLITLGVLFTNIFARLVFRKRTS